MRWMVAISPSAAGLLIKLIASQQAQVVEDRNGSSAGMTSTRSTRLLTHRKQPKLPRCQNFPLSCPPALPTYSGMKR